MSEEMGPVIINGQRYLRPVIKVADITVDGATCTAPAAELLDTIDGGGEYTVRIRTMSRAEFESMPEFMGW